MADSIRFDIKDLAGTRIPTTRIGGIPDVDDKFIWPRYGSDNRPLSFIAQFDCSDLGLEELPSSGLLSFFYDLEDRPWHTDAGCRVFWFPDKEVLSPADVPNDLGTESTLPVLDVMFHEEEPPEEPMLMSKLLGVGDPIQDSVEEECAYMKRDGNPGAWRLLLQLDSIETDHFSLLFSDMGCIYFLIPEKDLISRRFDRAVLILQSC